jgi:hypothetical protein
MSAHTTSCPSCAKQAAVVNPTYPAPITAIFAMVLQTSYLGIPRATIGTPPAMPRSLD